MERDRGISVLSKQVCSIWAKSDYGEGEQWLPLVIHSVDALCVMTRLWKSWLPQDTRSIIASEFESDEDAAFRVACFLAACHDIGKATPSFQQSQRLFGSGLDEGYDLSWKPRKVGLPLRNGLQRGRLKHPIASELIVEEYLVERRSFTSGAAESWGAVVGSHHGKPPLDDAVSNARSRYDAEMGWDARSEGAWRSVQFEIMDYLWMAAGLDDAEDLGRFTVSAPAACLLCGLVILCDWIASNVDLFELVPLVGPDDEGLLHEGVVSVPKLEARAERAWRLLELTPSWQPPAHVSGFDERWFVERFGLPAGSTARPVQSAAIEVARSVEKPGIMIIEAPMGEGKTEAALAAAEILATRFGFGGVCFALPTMATTDAMFGRVRRWLDALPVDAGDNRRSIYLAHGKAQLNEEFQGIVRASRRQWRSSRMNTDDNGASCPESVIASDWLSGRKKGMLSNFTVCTVDQVLMGALMMKHLPLRQLALANKVVVIDECHAYDVYMQEYLKRILEWLGAWRVPVVLLSATLPRDIRRDLVSSYIKGIEELKGKREVDRISDDGAFDVLALLKAQTRKTEGTGPSSANSSSDLDRDPVPNSYPLITYSEGGEEKYQPVSPSSRETSVSARLCSDDEEALVALLKERLSGGGCAGVICGTVSRAQETATLLREAFGDEVVLLTHARFVDVDRMDNERRLRSLLGPDATVSNGRRPQKLIVVGTQVLEQSLDVDFDVLVTDVAPVDLIMQRMGRLHRHKREGRGSERPEKLRNACCFVRGVDEFAEAGPRFAKGLVNVYEEASLIEALAALGLKDFDDMAEVCLPSDICRLVQTAYSSEDIRKLIPSAWTDAYISKIESRAAHCEGKVARAKKCLLPSVGNVESMKGLFPNVVEEGTSKTKYQEDRGQMAVRDTQETVEVLLIRKCEGELHLLPWIGDKKRDVDLGARIPMYCAPEEGCAQVLAQSAVRLPLAMCRYEEIDGLITALEEACDSYASAWQESPWLAGRLILALEDEDDGLSAEVFGWCVSYSRKDGLQCGKL